MTDEIKLQRDLNRAAKAEALLRNELLTEAFDALDADYIKAWRETPVRDTEARERLWQATQIVGLVRDHISNVVNDGKLAQAELKRIADFGQRKKIFGVV